MSTYRKREKARKRKEIMQGIALIVTVVAIFGYMPTAMKKADCTMALENISFIDRCIDAEFCTITANEKRSYDNWHRLKLKSCEVE